MTFEEIVKQLNGKGMLLDTLSQIEDGKIWSVRVRQKGTTKYGYGSAKIIEKAVKEALGNMRDPYTYKWNKVEVNPKEQKRKRVRMKAKK